ncbi:MAG TPA: NAD(P)H-binding protein [Terracidiphilus sp.]|nr:NAD(P)H-binding protein [Terracidiphilus sp.]
MRLVIFGASGATGEHLVQQALAQNHLVTAFARRPESVIAAPAPDLTVVTGDIHDAGAVSAAIAGHDAVLSALGARNLGHSDVLEVGIRNILAGMKAHGVRRIIVLGASGAVPGAGKHQGSGTRAFLQLIGSTLLREPFRSQRDQERLLAASDTQYTIVRPPRLLNQPAIGHYRVQEDGLPPGGLTVPRTDVAEFMLRQLTDPAWIRKAPYLAT